MLEYNVMRGVGKKAEAEEMFRINPFLRSTIWGRTSNDMRVTERTLQLMSDSQN